MAVSSQILLACPSGGQEAGLIGGNEFNILTKSLKNKGCLTRRNDSMKIAYAYRRSAFYPFYADEAWILPTGKMRGGYLQKVKEIGFEGIELGVDNFGGAEATKERVLEIKRELDDAGVPCIAIRAGGSLCQPNVMDRSRKRLEKAVEIAGWVGAGIVNTALSGPARNPQVSTGANGAPQSHGSSQQASADDYARTAKVLKEIGDRAGGSGITITIEVHQHSLADNSWTTMQLLDLADCPNVLVNPDLGNVLWTYENPEESSEQCIDSLASRSKYWHCKSLQRIHIPEINHTYFLRVPLPDGDIDYRYAISAMLKAGYDGYLAIEGANTGDQLSKDRRSLQYVRELLAELGA